MQNKTQMRFYALILLGGLGVSLWLQKVSEWQMQNDWLVSDSISIFFSPFILITLFLLALSYKK